MTQFLRFAVVGIASNAFLYALYLWLTSFLMTPIIAMTTLYALGLVQTYVFNRRWSFSYKLESKVVFIRYCSVYIGGYIATLATFHVFVDVLKFNHQWIQGVMIIVVAILTFVLHKFWVFK